jgi:hypothetical protein
MPSKNKKPVSFTDSGRNFAPNERNKQGLKSDVAVAVLLLY